MPLQYLVASLFVLASILPIAPCHAQDTTVVYISKQGEHKKPPKKGWKRMEKRFKTADSSYTVMKYDKKLKLYTSQSYATEDHQVLHGKFTRYDDNGTQSRSGYYNKGKKDGVWVYRYPTDTLQGRFSYVLDVRHGEQLQYHENGRLSGRAMYQNGEENGLTEGWYENGQRSFSVGMKVGIKSGETASYYENGQLRLKVNYIEDKMHGPFTSYYENSQQNEVLSFQNGSREGEAKKFRADGSLLYKVNYTSNKRDGTLEAFYANGKPLFKGNFSINVVEEPKLQWFSDSISDFDRLDLLLEGRSGECTTWFEDGSVRSRENYGEEGKRNGKWVRYFDNRQLRYEIEYENGKLIGDCTWFNEDGSLNAKYDKASGISRVYMVNDFGKIDSLAVDLNGSDNRSQGPRDPQYKKGNDRIMQDIGQATKYPKRAKKKGEEGRVFMTIHIGENGRVVHAIILVGVSPELDRAALNALRALGEFEHVNRDRHGQLPSFRIPIRFKL